MVVVFLMNKRGTRHFPKGEAPLFQFSRLTGFTSAA
jgi:hypothetical protein